MTCETTESLLQQGYQARREHHLEDAKSLFETAVLKCRRIKSETLLARSLVGLGQVERDLESLETALDLYTEAVQILRTLNDPLALAHAVRHVGDIQRHRRQFDQAALAYLEALEIYRANEAAIPLDLANTLRGYALLQGELGRREEAKLLWAEAGQLYLAVRVQAGVDESERQIALLTS